MHELFQRHYEWWLKHRRNDTSRHCLLGMLKAIRNFVHPLLQPSVIGLDKRPAAVEAIGDMLMYTWSLYHVRGHQWQDNVSHIADAFDVDACLGALLQAISDGLTRGIESSSVALCVATLADACCIPLEEAAAISIEKLPC